MNERHVLTALIGARTALKTDRPARALELLRLAIKEVDPDGKLMKEMWGDLEGKIVLGDKVA